MNLFIKFALVLMFASTNNAEELTGKTVLKKMYDRYHGKWHKNLTFEQDTKMYRADTLNKSEKWHEVMVYPNKFRIDMGPKDSGNAVIFLGDSAYRFKHKKLVSIRFYENDLLFLLGGMYYLPFEKVTKQVEHYGFDITKAHKDTWKGKSVFVIGAEKGNLNTDQLWIDEAKLVVVRMLTFKDNHKEESLFEDQLLLAGGYTETTSIFYVDDKMFQHEKYHNCKANTTLNPKIFDVMDFGKYYWY